MALLVALVAALTTAALMALGLLGGVLGTDGLDDLARSGDVASAGTRAPAVAERAAAAILAYDARSMDADVEAATGFMTPQFARQYTATIDRVVREQAVATGAKVTVAVQGSAVVRAGEDRARVLLFVDQTTVSDARRRPQLALNRVEMMMVLRGGSWLVDDIRSF